MQQLQGNTILLRALEPSDIDFLYAVENDPQFWEVSSTQTPFSRYLLEQYIANAHLDIFTAKQLRLVIVVKESKRLVGMIDLFDFSPQHQRTGIGILIIKDQQRKGYASEALSLVISYCFDHLNLHQIYANITTDNQESLALFKKFDFEQVGIKKDWIQSNNDFKDEVLFQRLKK